MKNERLLKIIYILIEKEFVTAKELAETLEVSIRTIYRDIDSLTAANIPVYTTSGKGGGVGLLEDYVVDKSQVTNEEQLKILKALDSTKKTTHIDVDDTIDKLKTLFESDVTSADDNWLEVDLSRWGSSRDNEKFEELKQAIAKKSSCTFTYVTPTGKLQKTVNPVKLIFKSNAWYLQAYSLDKNGFRVYKLSQILNLRELSSSFDVYPNIPSIMLGDAFSTLYDEVVLKFSANVAYKLFDAFEQDQIIETETGSYQVNARIPVDQWLVNYILSFGHEVEILQPIHLIKKVKEEVRKLHLKYND